MATSLNLVKTNHFTPYPAISPSLPELSQKGKTVLVTGVATGIGLAIAEASAQADASTIVMVGRRADVLNAAVSKVRGLMKDPKANVIGH